MVHAIVLAYWNEEALTEVNKYWAKLLLLDISIVMLYSRDEDDTEKEGKKQPPM